MRDGCVYKTEYIDVHGQYICICMSVFFLVFFFMEAIGRQDVCPIWLPASATFCLKFYVICMYYNYNLACCK